MKKRKIKRVIANAMALLMMINALPVTDGWFHPMTSYASTARVNATSLNVRSGPGTTYSIAGKRCCRTGMSEDHAGLDP